jgi:predicted permease
MWWRRRRALKGLDEDIRDHIARETEEGVARGMTPEEARRQALVKFGNVSLAKEDTRGVWVWTGLEAIQDVRYVLRMLRRSPGFTATVILTLALGIGATTAIFSVADAALFRPALYPNPERIVRIYLEPEDASPGGFMVAPGRSVITPSAWDFKNWLAVARSFDSIATSTGSRASFLVEPPEIERLTARAISADYFRVYGIQPFLGRGFTSQDQEPNAPPVVILSYRFWRDRLGGDRAVLGTPIRFEEGAATIVGVLPQSLSPSVAVWRPLARTVIDSPKPTSLPVFARLKPGVSLSQAQAELALLTPSENPMRSRRGAAIPFVTAEVRALEGPTVWILLGAVGCVLMIACVNVAGLQFARGVSRQEELVVRSALGAGRWRLFRLVLTESLVLAAAGGLIGVGLAWLTLDGLLGILPVQIVTRPVALNSVVLTSVALVSIASGLIFGLLPAARLSAVRLGARSLRVGSGQRSTVATRRTGGILIAAEVALALVLLAGSSLMGRTLLQLHAVDLGFDPGRFVALDVEFVDGSRSREAYAALFERVRMLPGLTTVGAVSALPLGGASFRALDLRQLMSFRGADLSYLDGTPAIEPEHAWEVREFLPGYFEAIGLRRLSGRWPSTIDCGAAMPPVVVNESAARRLFPSTTVVGQRIRVRGTIHHIAAVAGDVRHSGPQEDVVPEIYLCRDDSSSSGRELLATSTVVVQPRRGTEVRSLLRAAVLGMGEPVTNIQIRSGSELFAEVTALPRHRTQLLSLLGGLGLVLAMVGVFGMTAHSVARRTREVGIRMAFGARPVDAVLAIVRDAALSGAIGIALGLLVAYLSAPVLNTFLFQTAPRDPVAFGSAAIALAVAGLLAAWMPARRAARVNPVEALRAE